jgi:hypothetical protein
MRPALEELECINDYSKKYHRDTNSGKVDSELINDGELQGYVKHTLDIVGGYLRSLPYFTSAIRSPKSFTTSYLTLSGT